MKEIKKLKFQEPHKFKRKLTKTSTFNLKLAETFDSANSAAERSNLEKSEVRARRMWEIARGTAKTCSSCWRVWIRLEDEKHIYSAERRARAVMSFEKKSSEMIATKRFSPLRGKLCLQVPNPKLSPLSQALPILVSFLVVLTLKHASLVERPGIGVPAAQRRQSSPTSQLKSDWMSRICQV